MNVLIQLNSPLGAGVGPNFNLTANVGIVVPSTATAIQLLAGIIAIVSNTATIINIIPNGGECPTTISLPIPALPITTTSTSTTTIAPLCQCMLIYNTNIIAVTVQYINCRNQLVGLFLAANGSMQVCGSNVTPMDGVNVTLGGPCASSESGYVCTSCSAETCGTYLIINTSITAQTFQYIDCTGASVTATVQGKVGIENGQINICSCNVIEFSGESNLESSLISVDCILCKCYKIYNPTSGTLNYSWTDCETESVTAESILAGQIQYICSLSNGFTPDLGLIITNPNSQCEVLGAIGGVSASLLPPCTEPETYCYTVTITGNVTIEYVNYDGILTTTSGTNTILYLCAWQNSIVKIFGSGTITISAPSETTCQFNWECEPCYCYTVYNISGASQTLEYVDCDDISPVTQVITTNSSFNYCGKYPLDAPSMTVVKGVSCVIDDVCETQVTTTTTIAATTTTTTTTAPITTTTTLLTSCYRIANSTTSPIVATYYDETGFPNFVTIPAQTGITYQCASSITAQAGLTIEIVGNCSYFKCAGITTTTTTVEPTTTTAAPTTTTTTSTTTTTTIAPTTTTTTVEPTTTTTTPP